MKKIIENFLDKQTFVEIQNILKSDEFPYYLQKGVAFNKPDSQKGILLTHAIIRDRMVTASEKTCELIFEPIIKKLKEIEPTFKEVVRAKINFYPLQFKKLKSDYHIDYINKHRVLILAINTCNGSTEFEDGTNFDAIENNAIIFDGHTKHRSVNQTDELVKLNVNINYECNN